MAYASVAEATEWLGPDTISTNHGAALAVALETATIDINSYCGRTFTDAGSASARWFFPDGHRSVVVDDFSTTTGLIVATDDNDDGTAETTWATTDYVLEPINGRRNGQTWPYYTVRAVESRWFPWLPSGRPAVYVTARWGWATVPDAVKQATLIHAAAIFHRRNSPQGVAGFGEFGAIRVRGGMDADAARLLTPYRKHTVAAGIFG